MPEIQHDISLKKYNTFGVEAKASHFVSFSSEDELNALLKDHRLNDLPALILGGGSNILFTRDFEGLVMHNNIRGIEILEEDDSQVLVKAGAGENWDEFVGYTVSRGWGGLENLSYIPGNVGASPIQNIGAYGTEVKETIEQVQTLNRETFIPVTYTNGDCQFDYRNSIFKHHLKGKRIITHVVFRLSKKPDYKLSYGNLKEAVSHQGEINLTNIRHAVIETRKSKLPEPDETGSAGSFFKNPIIDSPAHQKLKTTRPDMPSYPMENNQYKIPAGWLIDQLGWKGYREGDAGVHHKQALVLVNHGQATGDQIYQLSRRIRESVLAEFNIDLEYEVNIL
jgi:UDP-N-acetylmuramate dehydrogenase